MLQDDFRGLVRDYLLPLFSGAQVEPGYATSSSRRDVVRYTTVCSMEIKPDESDEWCLTITRSQPFTQLQTGRVSEHSVASAFVAGLAAMPENFEQGSYVDDLMTRFGRRLVVNTVCPSGAPRTAALNAIDILDSWSARLYEGQPISAAVGFTQAQAPDGLTLSDAWAEDFGAVLTNAFDTMVTANYEGMVAGYEVMSAPAQPPMLAPQRLGAVADWTNQATDRVAFVLNRADEILALRRGELVYARRGGRWYFLSPEAIVTQMGGPNNLQLRQAVYASCLDASFARTGACVGILGAGYESRLGSVAPKREDHISPLLSPKARMLDRAIQGRRFGDLDRRLRQEIMAIDGATILDHNGYVLAAGAILRVPGGSTGGGRRAAAVALSQYGVGIKVSADGGIEGFRRPTDGSTERPTFKLMK